MELRALSSFPPLQFRPPGKRCPCAGHSHLLSSKCSKSWDTCLQPAHKQEHSLPLGSPGPEGKRLVPMARAGNQKGLCTGTPVPAASGGLGELQRRRGPVWSHSVPRQSLCWLLLHRVQSTGFWDARGCREHRLRTDGGSPRHVHCTDCGAGAAAGPPQPETNGAPALPKHCGEEPTN